MRCAPLVVLHLLGEVKELHIIALLTQLFYGLEIVIRAKLQVQKLADGLQDRNVVVIVLFISRCSNKLWLIWSVKTLLFLDVPCDIDSSRSSELRP